MRKNISVGNCAGSLQNWQPISAYADNRFL